MKERFDWAYRFRGLLMVPPYAALMLVCVGETEHELLIWPIGLGVFFAGVVLRVWAQMHLHYRLRMHKVLTTSGPYAFVRNPIYIANTAILLGLAVVSELLWFVPVMLAWCAAVYALVVRREEGHLSTKYGKPYADYLEAVPRWRPSLHRLSSGRLVVRPFFWVSVRAELHCLLWLIPLLGKEFLVDRLF